MAKAKGDNRDNIGIKCTVCKEFRRPTEKNKKNTTEKLEIKKYCPRCKKVTLHKEVTKY